jgi:hypothetical protein
MAWNANDASRRAEQRRLQQQQQQRLQQQQQQQQRRFHRGNQQRAARQMSDLMAQYRLRRSRGGESGPLTPESPIGGLPAEPEMASPASSAGSRESEGGLRPGWSGEVGGTVLDVSEPVVNVNPWLVIDIRTDDGEAMVVRGWFFWGAIRAPHVAAGQHIRVGGRLTRQGYIKPSYIINESTGSRWRRWLS